MMAAKALVSDERTVIYQGTLHKRGHVHRAWKERWFVLSSDFKLRYFESRSKSEQSAADHVLGTIDLLHIERVEVSALLDLDRSLIPKYFVNLDRDKGSVQKGKDDALPSGSTSMLQKYSESRRCLLMNLVTASRSYKVSASSSESLVEWLRNLDRYLYGGVVMESFLEKKGSDHKSYKRRYFAVNRYRQIKYFDNKFRETLHGVIDLNDAALSIQYSVNEQLIELRSEKRKWILFVEDVAVYKQWLSALRSLKPPHSSRSVPLQKGSPSTNTLDPELWAAPSQVAVDRKDGDVLREWLKAQSELKRGDQPTVCMLYGVRLKQMGKARRKGTTVADLQIFLHHAGVGRRAHFGADTDNEWTDDEDEDEEEDEDSEIVEEHKEMEPPKDAQQQSETLPPLHAE